MSDAGRKMDVEDVLSSIRRLVSEEARTAPNDSVSAKKPSNSEDDMLQHSNEKSQDKLVLTPSLRVPENDMSGHGTANIEQRIADIESLVMSEAVAHPSLSQIDDVEIQEPDDHDEASTNIDPAPEDDFQATASFENETSAKMDALNLSVHEFARAEPPLTANLSKAPSSPASPQEQALEADILSAMAKEFTDISEPDTQTFSPDFEPEIEAEIEEAEIVSQADALNDSPFQADLEGDAPEPVFMGESLNLKESIVEREPVLRATEEPNRNEEPTRNDPEINAAASSPFENPIDYTEEDETFLDEETLREMVSEMVRSELQGELGDRITRNVRKLVRREIYRALASREFE